MLRKRIKSKPYITELDFSKSVEYVATAAVTANGDTDYITEKFSFHHQAVVNVTAGGTAGTAQVAARPVGSTIFVNKGVLFSSYTY